MDSPTHPRNGKNDKKTSCFFGLISSFWSFSPLPPSTTTLELWMVLVGGVSAGWLRWVVAVYGLAVMGVSDRRGGGGWWRKFILYIWRFIFDNFRVTSLFNKTILFDVKVKFFFVIWYLPKSIILLVIWPISVTSDQFF